MGNAEYMGIVENIVCTWAQLEVWKIVKNV